MNRTFFIVFFIFFLTVACLKHQPATDLVITNATFATSKGLILLIHGAAPLNKDGRIPVDADIIYARTSMYKELAMELNSLGWDVARYSKFGVYDDNINYEEYKKTDLSFTLRQLNDILEKLPKDKPLVVFAASEGTLHVPHLQLQDARAMILLGAVATNIGEIFLDQASSDGERSKIQERLNNAFKMKKDEMWGKSHPAGRIVDELNLKANWTYYEKFSNIPMLILHGEKDKEVNISQLSVWKEKLPNNNISTIVRPNGNHVYGTGETFDAPFLAKTMNDWLEGL